MINKNEIKFTLPDISDVEINNVIEVLRSGWITTGPKTKLLEKKLAAYVNGYDGNGLPPCVCLGSATAAMELALRLLGIGQHSGGSADDEVITCAYTYTASASVIDHVGAKIVLVDCSDKDGSVEMDYDKLEAAITEHTKAIIPVDIAGVPCDYDRVFEIVERKKSLFKAMSPLQEAIGRVAVIEDAAHALGAWRMVENSSVKSGIVGNGNTPNQSEQLQTTPNFTKKMVGSIADFTAFSFHATKNYTTGEGGALTWKRLDGMDDNAIYRQLQLFSLHGQSKDAFAKDQLGAWEYDIVGTWYKCNMTDLAAAVGLGQLERYGGMLSRRKEIIEQYDTAFKPLGINVLDHYNDNHISSGHLYMTWIPGIKREQTNQIMKTMALAGISTNVHFKPLPLHTAYKNLGFDIENYPVAYAKFENEISLPLHTRLTEDDVAYVIRQFIDAVGDFLK